MKLKEAIDLCEEMHHDLRRESAVQVTIRTSRSGEEYTEKRFLAHETEKKADALRELLRLAKASFGTTAQPVTEPRS